MAETRKVLIIEDDSIQARRLEELIVRNYPDAIVHKISTELEFHRRFPGISDSEYKVALVDMMLRWTDPSPQMEAPPSDVVEQGFFVGGLRCRGKLMERSIPSIIFTIHDRESFPQLQEEGVEFLQKGPSYDPVLKKLIQYLGVPSKQPRPSDSSRLG
jgi:hypothetical protein